MSSLIGLVDEGTTSFLGVSFLDKAGDPVVPTSATYRIDDESSGTAIRAATAIGSLSSSIEIEISDVENRILSNPGLEVRLVTLEYEYGVGNKGKKQERYAIVNLNLV